MLEEREGEEEARARGRAEEDAITDEVMKRPVHAHLPVKATGRCAGDPDNPTFLLKTRTHYSFSSVTSEGA